MESESALTTQYEDSEELGEKEITTDAEKSHTTGTDTSSKLDDSESFNLRGIMLQPDAFGEGRPSSISVDYRRPKKMIGYLSKQRFGKFGKDVETKQPYPYLLDLRSLYLTELTNVEQYKHITYLDLTYNKITNEGLDILPQLVHLLTLILDHNKVKSMTLPIMKNLMYLSLNKNLLTTMSSINQPNLQFLFLNENRIRFVRFVDTAPKLHTLSISHCRLNSMSAHYAQSLEKLFLSYNNISSIEGLDGLVNLKWLHLRGNKIKKLTGFNEELSKLYYVNLRDNEIAEEQQLKQLKILPLLRILILIGNPINDGEEIRQMVLLNSPNMRRINKYLVEEEEAENAKKKMEEADEEEQEETKLSSLSEGSA
ncbi:leucine-rich repeat-containing protein 23-like [Rhodnius prolixus]|uniref:Uncharacterized protein n=1 Tax=Rhodnius prolixus TaxID=13249 RepID=T1HCX3_RHOPR